MLGQYTIIIINSLLMPIKRCHVAFQAQEGKVFKLLQPIQCMTKHSYSAILAISSHFIKNYTQIDPAGPQQLVQKLKLKITPIFNPLFELWHDFLIQCIHENRAQRDGEDFYICIPTRHLKNMQIFSRSDIFQQFHSENLHNTPNYMKCSIIFSIPIVQRTKRIGFYIISQKIDLIPVVSRLTPAALLIGQLFNNQRWQVFDIPTGKIPTSQHLQNFNAVIIPGSTETVFNQTPETKSAFENLICAYGYSEMLKIVGICYGHQWVARYFGGEVVRKELRRDITEVFINKDIIKELPYLQALKEPPHLLLSQYNEDFVETVPKGFDLLAYSKGCKVEGLLSQDKRILTVQFHSQFLYDYVFDLQEQLRRLGAKQLDYLKIPKEITDANNRDSMLFLGVISGFIDA